MIEKYIKPGQRVEMKAIKRTSKKEDAEEKVYASKVYDVVSDDEIEIEMPMEQTKLILLPVDGEYEVNFYAGPVLYECVARVIDRYKSNNVYILLFELETNLRKHQRREYYRYSCALDMDSRNLSEEEIFEAGDKQDIFRLVPGLPLKHSIIADISGGGLRFISNYEYERESLIVCKFELFVKGQSKIYEIVGKVLNVRLLETRNGGYEHRVQFVNISNQTREEIIQFIFDEERKHRQKESRWR